MARRLTALLPIAAFVGLWVIGSATLGGDTLPPPDVVAVAFLAALQDPAVWDALGGTLWRTLLSFFLAALIGIPIGILPGRAGPLRAGTDVLLDFGRSIPGPLLLPAFMSIWGLYAGPKVALAVFVCTLVNAVYAGAGVAASSKLLRVDMATSFGAGRAFVFWRITLPGALQLLVAGLRVTLSLALVLSVLGELFLMTGEGLGVLTRLAYEDRKVPEMYALIVLSGVLGTLLNLGFELVERRTAWYRQGTSRVRVPPALD